MNTAHDHDTVTSMRLNMLSFASTTTVSPDMTARGRGRPRHTGTTHDQHEHGRGLKEIREIIRKAGISEGAKRTAIAIFEALGAAEAKIHNSDIEKVHFHEVGAVDAMVDIVCSAVGAEALGCR